MADQRFDIPSGMALLEILVPPGFGKFAAEQHQLSQQIVSDPIQPRPLASTILLNPSFLLS